MSLKFRVCFAHRVAHKACSLSQFHNNIIFVVFSCQTGNSFMQVMCASTYKFPYSPHFSTLNRGGKCSYGQFQRTGIMGDDAGIIIRFSLDFYFFTCERYINGKACTLLT